MADKKPEDMSLEELIALKEQFALMDAEKITPEQRKGLIRLDVMITQKATQETLKANEQGNAYATNRAKADEQAGKRWPELGTADSEMNKAVDAYMQANPNPGDPNELFHAANAVGLELGLQPAGTKPTPGVSPTGQVKNGGGGADDGTGAEEEGFLKRTSAIAKKYADVIDLNDKEAVARIEAFAAEPGEED